MYCMYFISFNINPISLVDLLQEIKMDIVQIYHLKYGIRLYVFQFKINAVYMHVAILNLSRVLAGLKKIL